MKVTSSSDYFEHIVLQHGGLFIYLLFRQRSRRRGENGLYDSRLTRSSISICWSYNCWPYLWSFRRSIHSNRQKLPSAITTLTFDAPAKRNPGEYPHAPYISRN